MPKQLSWVSAKGRIYQYFPARNKVEGKFASARVFDCESVACCRKEAISKEN
jgi:hypothetical protein